MVSSAVRFGNLCYREAVSASPPAVPDDGTQKKMTKPIRTTIFIAFALFFAVSAPLVALTTAGFRYNWKKHRIEKTGVLQLDSRPRGAKVMLNGGATDKTTPASIFRVLPEDYLVRMEKPGYFPWQKTLEVPSGGTAFARDVILYADSLPQLAYGATIEASAWNPDARAVALVVRDADGGRHAELYFPEGEGFVRVLPWAIPAGATVRITFDPTGKAAIFDITAGPSRKVAVAYVDDSGTNDALGARIRTIPLAATAVHWSADGGTVTALEGKVLAIIDPTLGNDEEVRVPDGTRDALLSGKVVALLTKDSVPPETADDGTLLKTLDTETGALTTVRNVCTRNQRCSLLAFDGKRILLLREENVIGPHLSFTTLSAPHEEEEVSASAYRWEKIGDKGRLLLWNEFEVSVYDPDAKTKSLITRLGTPITAVAWDPRGNDVIVATADTITAIELDDRDVRNSYTLIRATRIDGFGISHDGSSLRFTGAIGGQNGVFEKALE
jgi:hypothetical protein